MENTMTDYNIDYYQWIQEQIQLLTDNKLDKLDVENLIDQLKDNAWTVRNELETKLNSLMRRLIDWEYVVDDRERNNVYHIKTLRREIQDLIQENPSLRNDDLLFNEYEYLINLVIFEVTVLPESRKNRLGSYTWDQILDDNYYPGELNDVSRKWLDDFGIEVQ